MLERFGVETGRVEFAGYRPRTRYLELFQRVDICLDTVPYNGHTTSLDSLWMGVPVVTLVGNTVVGRAGCSQLENLDLPELIASTPEAFVEVATRLAADRARLEELRRTLRSRMEQSPLMDAKRFARDVEAAYREMWRRWCARTQARIVRLTFRCGATKATFRCVLKWSNGSATALYRAIVARLRTRPSGSVATFYTTVYGVWEARPKSARAPGPFCKSAAQMPAFFMKTLPPTPCRALGLQFAAAQSKRRRDSTRK